MPTIAPTDKDDVCAIAMVVGAEVVVLDDDAVAVAITVTLAATCTADADASAGKGSPGCSM